MQEALRNAGINARNISRGEIYWVRDEIIVLPKNRLPKQKREFHERRPVLILQTDIDNQDISYVMVLVAPLSSRTDLKDDKDIQLHKGQSSLDNDCLVQLGLIQPILKIDLAEKPIGKLDALTLAKIDSIVAANLGLIERPKFT